MGTLLHQKETLQGDDSESGVTGSVTTCVKENKWSDFSWKGQLTEFYLSSVRGVKVLLCFRRGSVNGKKKKDRGYSKKTADLGLWQIWGPGTFKQF